MASWRHQLQFRRFSSTTGGQPRVFQAQPRWKNERHFDAALASIGHNLSSLDIDLADQAFPGSVYKFQYGGYTVQEILSPFLDACSFRSERDRNRLLQLAFLLDRKYALWCFDEDLTPDRLDAFTNDVLEKGAFVPKKQVAGGVALAFTCTKDDVAERLDSHHYGGTHLPSFPEIFTGEEKCETTLSSWASAECDAYLIAVRETCNVTFVDWNQRTVVVSTKDIAAGEPLRYADGLAPHLQRVLRSKISTSVDIDALRKPFLSREKHVMGSGGMLERSAII